MSVMNFYEAGGENGYMTNFFIQTVKYCGMECPSTEHGFQMCKYLLTPKSEKSTRNVEYANRIRTASTPNIAKLLANQKVPYPYAWAQKIKVIIEEFRSDVLFDPDWDQKKVSIMLDLLILKFQEPTLQQNLISTTGKRLIEHTHRDNFWGDGGDGTGKNVLGSLLEKVRDKLLGKPQLPPEIKFGKFVTHDDRVITIPVIGELGEFPAFLNIKEFVEYTFTFSRKDCYLDLRKHDLGFALAKAHFDSDKTLYVAGNNSSHLLSRFSDFNFVKDLSTLISSKFSYLTLIFDPQDFYFH